MLIDSLRNQLWSTHTAAVSASEQARNAALISAPLVFPFKSDLFLSRDKSKLSLTSGNISCRRAQKKLLRWEKSRETWVFMAYSSWKFVQMDSSALQRHTAWMGHDCISSSWRELDDGSNNKKENAQSVHTPARPDSVPIRKLFYFRGLSLPSVERYCTENKETYK